MPEPAFANQELERITIRGELDDSLTASDREQIADDYFQNWDDRDLDGTFVVDPTVWNVRVEGPYEDIDAALDDMLDDPRVEELDVLEREDIESKTFSEMRYHVDTDAHRSTSAGTSNDELVRVFVDVQLVSGLTDTEKLNLADHYYSDIKSKGLGGVFVVDPTVWFLQLEGPTSEVSAALDTLTNYSEVEDAVGLSEEYPTSRLLERLSVQTLDDPRHID